MTDQLRTLATKLREQLERSARLREELANTRAQIAELRPQVEAEVIASLKAGERVTDVSADSGYTRERVRQLRHKNEAPDQS